MKHLETVSNSIPFVDLSEEWSPLKGTVLDSISRVFEHGMFVEGPEVGALEQIIQDYLGVGHAITCSSGTTALLIAMMALGIGPGDEIIIPSYTFAAPLECALLLGARPVLVDVSFPSGLIDLECVEAALSRQTKAIIAVGLYGFLPDMEKLSRLADENGVWLIEDAAQSYGARRSGRASGHFGSVSCLSFFPTKTLGGATDGGAVTTDDAALARRLRSIRDHGQEGKYRHVDVGLNGRMSSISAACLGVRHRALEDNLYRRRVGANLYDAIFSTLGASSGLCVYAVPDVVTPARALYPIALRDRDRIREEISRKGVGTAIHYPVPLHLQPAFNALPTVGSMKNSQRLAAEVLCLPLYPGLALEKIEAVAEMVLEAL